MSKNIDLQLFELAVQFEEILKRGDIDEFVNFSSLSIKPLSIWEK